MGLGKIAADVLIREAGTVLDDVITSEEERAALRIKLEEIRQRPELKALDERIEFAKHPSLFVAGGRPFVIWAAGLGIAFNVIAVPGLNWIGALAALWGDVEFVAASRIDWDELMVLAGLAGGASWVRHLDKVKGVARDNLRHPDVRQAPVHRMPGEGGLY